MEGTLDEERRGRGKNGGQDQVQEETMGGGLERTEGSHRRDRQPLRPSPVGSRSEVGVGKRSEGPVAEEVCPGNGAPFPEVSP